MIVRNKVRGSGGWWAVPGDGHYSLIQHTAEFTIETKKPACPFSSKPA
jgi:hypothetical protein